MVGKREIDQKFYLVREDVLPEAMKKTLEAKALLERGTAESIWEAVQQVDLSRSAFYKYRDTVFPFHTVVKEKIISLFFFLEDKPGALSKLLSIVASCSCNVLTIHQTIPLQGRANVTLSLDVTEMNVNMDEFLGKLRRLEFVAKVEVVSSGG
ncbi:ACT domain-containing protein [Siminovitchia sp. FSL H7-0308]|uniref:ACT domain-containing protein n=1 Tax=Siminovitchia sp. FSL H7-0308 TaxID=2921432 RepID=UPI0030EC435F